MYALLQDVIRFQQQENTTDYFLFNIERTDGVQYTDHGNTSVRENSHPHVCMSGQTEDHNGNFDDQCKYNVLDCDPVRCTGDQLMDCGMASVDEVINTTSAASMAASAPLPIAASDIGTCQNRSIIDTITDKHDGTIFIAYFSKLI